MKTSQENIKIVMKNEKNNREPKIKENNQKRETKIKEENNNQKENKEKWEEQKNDMKADKDLLLIVKEKGETEHDRLVLVTNLLYYICKHDFGHDPSQIHTGGLLELLSIKSHTKVKGIKGADATDGTHTYEYKNSSVIAKNGYRADFTFVLDSQDKETVAEHVKRCDEQWNEKSSGAFCFVVKRYSETINEYTVGSAFFRKYLKKFILWKRKKENDSSKVKRNPNQFRLNLGSVRCSTCNQYHRLQKLVELEQQWNHDKKSIAWDMIFSQSIKSQCQ